MGEDMKETKEDGNTLILTREEKTRIRESWKSALIIKVFGRSIPYNLLSLKISQLWNLANGFELISIGYGFHVVRLKNVTEIDKILQGGPWFINGQFLSMRRWEPNFRASTTVVSMLAMWIRFPELPIEYYDVGILQRIGGMIGPVLKIDAHTCATSRGRFARVCVQIDLSKPLVNSVKIGSDTQQIMYEGINSMCFECGMIGHEANQCKTNKETGETEEVGANREMRRGEESGLPRSPVRDGTKTAETKKDAFGPWMLVKGRKQNARQSTDGRGNMRDDQARGRPALSKEMGRVQEVRDNGKSSFELCESPMENAPTGVSGERNAFQFVVQRPEHANSSPKPTGPLVKPMYAAGPFKERPNISSPLATTQAQLTPTFPNPNSKQTSRRSQGKKKVQHAKERTSDGSIRDSWFGGANPEPKEGVDVRSNSAPCAIGEGTPFKPLHDMQEGGTLQQRNSIEETNPSKASSSWICLNAGALEGKTQPIMEKAEEAERRGSHLLGLIQENLHHC